MKAYSIDIQTQELKEIDIQIQANTVYSFFNSILIDELEMIKQHTIYTDSNALTLKKTPYFIGGQLVLGDALIVGKNEFEDCEVSIPKKDLELLISYDVTPFYTDVLEILAPSDLNLYRLFEIEYKNEKVQLNIEWVLNIFNIADDRTREYFINELKKVADSKEDTEQTLYKMAGLALNAQ